MADIRLIDANALKAIYENWLPQLESPEDGGDKNAIITCIAELEEAPTIEAEPVRHGKWRKGAWKTYPDGYVCSECDGGFAIPYNYCPHCGAKMDLEEDSHYEQAN